MSDGIMNVQSDSLKDAEKKDKVGENSRLQ